MGVIRIEYRFDSEPVPTPDQVAEKLAEVSGLTIDVRRDSDDWCVNIVDLGAELFLWETNPGSLALHTGITRNHYMEMQLDKTMALLGGHATIEVDAHLENPRLLCPWQELTLKEQRSIIKVPNLFMRLLCRNS